MSTKQECLRVGEIESVSAEESEAIAQLVRCAMHVVNLSPAGKALSGSEFAAAMRAGDAGMMVEIALPAGPIRILAQAGEGERRELVRIPFEWQRSEH